MPSVLIVSDSHGWSKEVESIKQRHINEVDDLIHCGDSELAFDSKELDEYKRVAGNCDMDSRFPNEINFKRNELTFFATHGHLYQVKSTLMKLAYRAEELNAQVICFGHSHVAGAEKINNQLFINPGSIRLPRGRSEGTYAILTWDDKKDVKVEFLDLDGIKIGELTYHTSFD